MSGAPSGIGYGEAQIYRMDKTANAFEQILQSQALERQKEQKAIAEQLKTLDTTGLREPDKDAYFQKYQKWQEASAKYRTEKDRAKKYTYQMESEKLFGDLKSHVSRSKEAYKNDTEFASRLLDDRFRDQFKDDAVTQFQGNFKKSIDDPTYVADKSVLGRQVNEDDFNNKIKELNETMLKKTAWSNPIEVKHTQGNRAGVLSFNKREVSQEEQDAAYMNLYRSDRDTRKFIADKYPDMDPETAMLTYAREVRATGVLSEGSAPQFHENDNWKEKALFGDALAQAREARAAARKGKTAGEEEATQRQQMVDGLLKGDKSVEDRLQGLVEANEKFLPKTDKNGKSVPSQIKIVKRKGSSVVTYVIPAKYALNASGGQIKTPEREVTIDMKQANAVDKVNQMISDVTDANITNESYRGTKGNKNKGTADIVKDGAPAPAPKKTGGVPAPKDDAGKTDSVTVTLDGKTGQIPADKWAAFKKKHPTAKRN